MEEILTRTWTDLIERGSGPFHLRFILQPAMAALIGIRDGLRYAREGRSFLLWGGPIDPAERRAQLLASGRAIVKVFVLAVVLDAIYQVTVLDWFYPLQTLIVAIGVAVMPYLLVRGSVNALARLWRRPQPSDPNPCRSTR